MSRSGYSDDCDGENWQMIMWAGAVKSAIRGKRGQAMLRETLAALDALPEKILAAESLVNAEGQYCTLGALGAARKLDMTKLKTWDHDGIAEFFGIAPALAREIMYLNDEFVDEKKWVEIEICGPMRQHVWPDRMGHKRQILVDIENVEQERFKFMKRWIERQIKAGEQRQEARANPHQLRAEGQ